MKSAAKGEKRAKKARAKARALRRRHLFLYSFYALAGVVILSFVLSLFLPYALRPQEEQAAGPGQAIPDMGNKHIPSVDSPHEPYNSDPPTSGPHVEFLAPWGIYDQPIPKEIQVKNLEDGGVIVHYRPGIPEGTLNRLKEIVQGYPGLVILAPYPELTSAIALTAWTRLDRMEELDEDRIRRFINAYRGQEHYK